MAQLPHSDNVAKVIADWLSKAMTPLEGKPPAR